jgi:hypothetical protein
MAAEIPNRVDIKISLRLAPTTSIFHITNYNQSHYKTGNFQIKIKRAGLFFQRLLPKRAVTAKNLTVPYMHRDMRFKTLYKGSIFHSQTVWEGKKPRELFFAFVRESRFLGSLSMEQLAVDPQNMEATVQVNHHYMAPLVCNKDDDYGSIEPYLRNLLEMPGFNFRTTAAVSPYYGAGDGFNKRQYFKVNIDDISTQGSCNIILNIRFKTALDYNLILVYWLAYKQALRFDNNIVRNVDVVDIK